MLPTNAKASRSKLSEKIDNRLFIRLPLNHDWRKLSPTGLRNAIIERMSVSITTIGLIKPVRSGFALSPSSVQAREELFKASGGLFLSGATLEPATNWVGLPVPTVPRVIYTLKERLEVTGALLADEIERVSSIRPAAVKPYGMNNPEAPHCTWLALFTKALRPGFRVFEESGLVRPFKKQRPLDFCKRCNGHHSAKYCSRAPSCGNCGSTMHCQESCRAPTKYRNCGDPHRSDSHRCLARPTRAGPPSKEQLKVYRQAGEREYQAFARARAAEERATAVTDQTPDIEADNTPTPLDEDLSGDQMRL